ncbi:MAG TPA: prolyl oligopeptidase family serine peptidase, partial [Candidatus Dormibacteraeota bacterium]
AYWEPAKWVAKLREAKLQQEDGRPLLMQTEMSAGHSGPSGRYESWREEALITAFVLSQLDLTS